MDTKKQLQVAEVIRRNFSIVLQNEGNHLYGTGPLVTVMQVKMSPDLGQARIYLSIHNAEDKDFVIQQMKVETVKLRSSLAARVRKLLRRVPDIALFLDETVDEMYSVNEILSRLRSEGQMGLDEDIEPNAEYLK